MSVHAHAYISAITIIIAHLYFDVVFNTNSICQILRFSSMFTLCMNTSINNLKCMKENYKKDAGFEHAKDNFRCIFFSTL